MFEIILPFSKSQSVEKIQFTIKNKKIIAAFKNFYNNKIINTDFCTYSKDKIKIKKAFFAKDKRVKDVWRYNIRKNPNTDSFELWDSKNKNIISENNKYIDEPAEQAKGNICLLIIESPHRYEYTKKFEPKAPAQNSTGRNIEKYFCEIINANDEVKKLFTDNMQLVICNPVQFQTSLYTLHRYPTLKKYAEVKAQIWYNLFENCGEKEKFIERIREYEPKIIINACTSTGRVELNNKEKTLKEIVSESLIEWEPDIVLFEAELHPSGWFQYGDNVQKKRYEINEGFYHFNKEMKVYFELLKSANMLSLNDDRSKLKKPLKKQIKYVNSLLNRLLIKGGSNKVKICLRGDNYSRLSNILFEEKTEENGQYSAEFYNRCFLLGNKSNAAIFCNYNENNPIPWPIDLINVQAGEFEYIFEQMRILVLNGDDFLKNLGNDLLEFFKDEQNKLSFCNVTRKLSKEDQLFIRDYYFWLLHLDGSRLKETSYYVTTTTDPDIAENYAYNCESDNPLSILYFVPNPLIKNSTSIEIIIKGREFVEAIGLPTYNRSIYPDEFEISIKGALFPHYIVGIYEYQNKNFIVNDNLFNSVVQNIDSVIQNGIIINQTNFYEYLNKTKYLRSFDKNKDGTVS